MCCLFHLFILKPPSQWFFNIPKVYSIFKKNPSNNNLPNHTPHPPSFFSLSEPNLFSSTVHSVLVSFFCIPLNLLSPRSSVASVSPVGTCHSYLVATLQHLMLLTSLSFWKRSIAFFCVCNHVLSVSCARCFSILSLNVDILQVTVLALFILYRLCLGKPQPVT